MKRFAWLLLVAALCLTGCGGEPTETSGLTTAAEAEAEVYFMNADPELQDRWQALAAAYEAETGVPVRVELADALPENLAGDGAPTLVSCGDGAWLEKLEGSLLDLSGTAVHSQMTTEKYNRTDGTGRVTAIAYRRQAYGLVVNEELLEQAGYSLEMLMDYGMLAMIAADIHSRSEKLGFDAFAPMSAGEAEELAAQLVNAAVFYELRDGGSADALSGSYLAAGRNFLDLLKVGITENDTARGAFDRGEAVFLPAAGGTGTMLPLLCGIEGEEDGGLWERGLYYWAVNANAPQVCIDAALDFLNWVVTGEAGTDMLAGVQCRRLFDRVQAPEEEAVTVEWVPGRMALPGGVDAAAEAMVEYLTGANEWSAVKEAFTN